MCRQAGKVEGQENKANHANDAHDLTLMMCDQFV